MFNVGFKATYQLFNVHPETGVETPLSGKFSNVLLTNGRNKMADFNWFTSCQVGTSSILPDKDQGGLQGYVNGTSTIEEDVTGLEPDYGWRRKRFRFPVGAAAGNLNEIGIGWSVTNGDLVTRGLTEDITGTQATIISAPDEYLDAVVEIRMYWPTVDATGTVTIDSVVYNYIARASQGNSQAAWADDIGTKISSYALFVSDWSFYNGDIADIVAPPNGVPYASDNTNDYTNAYSSGSYEITFGMSVGPTGWNATDGLLARTLVVKTTAGWYQIQFDNGGNGIPKTDQFTMQLQFILGWDEAVIP